MKTKRKEFARPLVIVRPDEPFEMPIGEPSAFPDAVLAVDPAVTRAYRRESLKRMRAGECAPVAEAECTYEDDAPKDGVWEQEILVSIPGGASWNPPPPGWRPKS